MSQMGINYAELDRAIAPSGFYFGKLGIRHARPDRAYNATRTLFWPAGH